MEILLPIFYFPPISWFAEFLKSDIEVTLEQFEHFPKQTYRNRTNIYAANGRLSLIIPVRHFGKTAMKDMEISYAEDWQKQHWRSIKSAYQASPYFEYYEFKLQKLYEEKTTSLVEFNLKCLKTILDILKLDQDFKLSEEYVVESEIDFRNHFSAKKVADKVFPDYYQSFSDKGGFIQDLSVLDLICNLGPESRAYIYNL
ncbi:WbqC family protein [Chryseobacterium sp. POL2]|uniref:WbqC family protein n=1 Tax=Chryseobacterium sp. POL2 TaxID=2713414 RepID=UPI0013E1E324|nr:WbqC family protein [Chryseobacterium sp. POL2]QIG90571.1 WbqC family protein [Chryseobacterium sp. POL2]